MAAKKKAATKKRVKKPSPEKGALVAVVQPPVQDPDEVIEERLERVELYRQAWELKKAGVPYSAIGGQLKVSKSTAANYVSRYQEYRGASPKIEGEREYQLTGLAELEEKVWREATKGDISWAVAMQAVRGAYSDRRDILGFDQAEPAVSEVGEGEVPSVGAALRLVADADDSKAS